MSWDEPSFKEKLEGTHEFPDQYTFKFIVRPEQRPIVEALLPEAEIQLKPSSGNKYVSVTLTQLMQSSEQVLRVYREAHQIEGIIAL